ncbi:hypothetical protein Tco_0294155 [Tanacetum coccineum]
MKAPWQLVCVVSVGFKSHIVYKTVQQKKDDKVDKNQSRKKSTIVTKEVSTSMDSNLFDVLSNMPNEEEVMNTIMLDLVPTKGTSFCEKGDKVGSNARNNKEARWAEGESGSDVDEVLNETANFMSNAPSSSKGGSEVGNKSLYER